MQRRTSSAKTPTPTQQGAGTEDKIDPAKLKKAYIDKFKEPLSLFSKGKSSEYSFLIIDDSIKRIFSESPLPSYVQTKHLARLIQYLVAGNTRASEQEAISNIMTPAAIERLLSINPTSRDEKEYSEHITKTLFKSAIKSQGINNTKKQFYDYLASEINKLHSQKNISKEGQKKLGKLQKFLHQAQDEIKQIYERKQFFNKRITGENLNNLFKLDSTEVSFMDYLDIHLNEREIKRELEELHKAFPLIPQKDVPTIFSLTNVDTLNELFPDVEQQLREKIPKKTEEEIENELMEKLSNTLKKSFDKISPALRVQERAKLQQEHEETFTQQLLVEYKKHAFKTFPFLTLQKEFPDSMLADSTSFQAISTLFSSNLPEYVTQDSLLASLSVSPGILARILERGINTENILKRMILGESNILDDAAIKNSHKFFSHDLFSKSENSVITTEKDYLIIISSLFFEKMLREAGFTDIQKSVNTFTDKSHRSSLVKDMFNSESSTNAAIKGAGELKEADARLFIIQTYKSQNIKTAIKTLENCQKALSGFSLSQLFQFMIDSSSNAREMLSSDVFLSKFSLTPWESKTTALWDNFCVKILSNKDASEPSAFTKLYHTILELPIINAKYEATIRSAPFLIELSDKQPQEAVKLFKDTTLLNSLATGEKNEIAWGKLCAKLIIAPYASNNEDNKALYEMFMNHSLLKEQFDKTLSNSLFLIDRIKTNPALAVQYLSRHPDLLTRLPDAAWQDSYTQESWRILSTSFLAALHPSSHQSPKERNDAKINLKLYNEFAKHPNLKSILDQQLQDPAFLAHLTMRNTAFTAELASNHTININDLLTMNFVNADGKNPWQEFCKKILKSEFVPDSSSPKTVIEGDACASLYLMIRNNPQVLTQFNLAVKDEIFNKLNESSSYQDAKFDILSSSQLQQMIDWSDPKWLTICQAIHKESSLPASEKTKYVALAAFIESNDFIRSKYLAAVAKTRASSFSDDDRERSRSGSVDSIATTYVGSPTPGSRAFSYSSEPASPISRGRFGTEDSLSGKERDRSETVYGRSGSTATPIPLDLDDEEPTESNKAAPQARRGSTADTFATLGANKQKIAADLAISKNKNAQESPAADTTTSNRTSESRPSMPNRPAPRLSRK